MIHYITTHGIGNAWVAAELQQMQAKGIPFILHSLYAPHQNFFGSEWAKRIDRETHLIYPLRRWAFLYSLVLAPWLYGAAFWMALGNALFSSRESFRARVRVLWHLLVACHWARSLRREKVDLIHAQWIHSAGSVGMYGAWLLGVPFSFTGHAADLFRDRVALRDKVRRAAFIVCISEFHRALYQSLGAEADKLHTVYCGIDPRQFPWVERNRPARHILSVGRVVEKKGFHVLIEACGELKQRGIDFHCTIAGNGPLAGSLKEQIVRQGLQTSVEVTDRAVMQEELPGLLARADIYTQPCVWSRDNDVDGTPRTLMEAMATGLPSVATRIAGLPDLVADGQAGVLVEPEDARQLADALQMLLTRPDVAQRLGRAGRELVLEQFDIERCLDPLAELYRSYLSAGESNSKKRSELSVEAVA